MGIVGKSWKCAMEVMVVVAVSAWGTIDAKVGESPPLFSWRT